MRLAKLVVFIDRKLFNKFKSNLAFKGKSMSDWVREKIREYID